MRQPATAVAVTTQSADCSPLPLMCLSGLDQLFCWSDGSVPTRDFAAWMDHLTRYPSLPLTDLALFASCESACSSAWIAPSSMGE